MKSLANLLAGILMLPAVGWYVIACRFLGTERTFPGFSQCLSLLPGLVGAYLRRAFYRRVLPTCGDDVHISFGSVMSHPMTSLGARVYIGVGCMLGDVTLEDDVLVGSHVSVINGRHQHGIDRLDVPIREQPGEFPRITIGRDAWIGDRALVMANIGEQAVVGAGSVVTKPIPARAIAVGNPARIVRMRDGGDMDSETLANNGAP